MIIIITREQKGGPEQEHKNFKDWFHEVALCLKIVACTVHS